MVSPEQFCSVTYDYIIVGGGTAGLTVAARLSENPNVTVAVIEAGGWESAVPGRDTPGLVGATMMNPTHDWAFTTVPQANANHRHVYQPRGKGLGGTSALNFLMMDRAPAHEYDAIERLGNPGWNWAEFLKYMKKSETTHPPDPNVAKQYSFDMPDEKWHGSSGPLGKTYPIHLNALHSTFRTTFENVGVPLNSEPNGGNIVGYSMQFASVDPRTSTRSFSASAYYVPNTGRHNLVVMVDALVSRLIFQPDSHPLVAAGVEFVQNGNKFTVSVRKEVILCAGSFQSPQILELSGIGNKEILQKAGVTQLLDLPSVGENLQDHLFAPAIYEINPDVDTIDLAVQDPQEMEKAQKLYKEKKGFLSSAVADLFAFLSTGMFVSPEQMKVWDEKTTALVQAATGGLKKQLDIQRQWYSDPKSGEAELIPFPGFFLPSGLTPTPKVRYSSMIGAIMHPLSRGSVHIVSADPKEPPAINPDYFSNPQDLETMVSILKFVLKVYDTKPLSNVILKRVSPKPEECASDAALAEYIKNTCSCVYHPVGTASMLPREDGGVVDHNLKVYGTANVRVVDASILPLELGCHIQATVYGIAEKAADIIKQSM